MASGTDSGSGHSSSGSTHGSLARLLRERRDEIVSRFVLEGQRKQLSPPGLSRPLLVDHIPKFLDEISAELARLHGVRSTHDAVDTSDTARDHGEQRWSLGFELEALVREYGLLRHCILSLAKDAGAVISIDEFDVLAKCLNVGVAEATTEYVRYRDQELDAQKASLEFLAEAGQLLAASLDYRSTLNRLLGLLIPKLADWCAIHLEGTSPEQMPLAHVDPTKVTILREIYTRFPLPEDSRYGYPSVVRTGEPQLMPAIEPDLMQRAAQSDEHLALLRQIGSCSWMILPLRVQGTMFGALTLAHSDSGRHFTDSDLLLASELARRAAVAIDNARLYELSQRERARVEAATRAKDEFVAMVSHELRTPLTAILGWARLLRQGSLPESKRLHALDVIERNARAQSELVSDLLDISRIISGKLRVNAAQMDFADVIDIAIEGVRPAAEAKRIEIHADLDRSSSVIRGDADRLHQVAFNLLANAVKFTPKHGRVELRLRRLASDLELQVKDDGEGIPASFLPHVFESFRQADTTTSRPHAGLGIGLSITKHIVELHGGSIEASSRGEGQGATFILRLPVSPLISITPGVSQLPATEWKVPEIEPGAAAGLRVLVVDDEPDARELLSYVFESSGMEVRVASSAAEALAELKTFTPHAIVSDIGMPDQDGYALIRDIRTLADEAKKSIPAIALTGFAQNEDRTRALLAGFNVHMSKPAEPAALLRAVLDLVGSARG